MRKLAAAAAALAVGCAVSIGPGGVVADADASSPPAPVLAVTGASLTVANAGQPLSLWSENGSARLAIASTTKIMTFLVVLEHLKDLHTVLVQNDWRAQAADSQIGLQPGERMSALSLLYALMLPSADDAAEDLAYNVGGGSVPRFVGWMNAAAAALGLRNTHYATPIGLDTPGNYSSPDDVVRLAAYMMGHYAIFRKIVDTYRARVWNADHTTAYTLVNTDDLIERYPWIIGIKTGHTAAAGYVLVSEGRRDGLTLIGAVFGTDSEYERDLNSLSLLDWGFSNFRLATPVRAGQVFSKATVPYEVLPAVVVAARGYSTVIAKGTPVRVSVGPLRPLTPPMAAGTILGNLRVRIPGRATVLVPLILRRALPSVPAIKKIVHFLLRPITLLLLALLVGIAAAVAVLSRRQRRREDRRARVRATRHLEER